MMVEEFLSAQGVHKEGKEWVQSYPGREYRYSSLPELIKNELLIYFLPVYGLCWQDILNFTNGKM